MNKKLNSNSSAGTTADSDKTPKIPTSSHACSNTFVVRRYKSIGHVNWFWVDVSTIIYGLFVYTVLLTFLFLCVSVLLYLLNILEIKV